jgi:hypothetical protein
MYCFELCCSMYCLLTCTVLLPPGVYSIAVKYILSYIITGLDRPWVFQEFENPRFQNNRQMKMVRLGALCTSRLYPPGNIPGTHFYWTLSRPQCYSAAGRIMSMKNSNDAIGNRTRNLRACSWMRQPTAPPRASWELISRLIIDMNSCHSKYPRTWLQKRRIHSERSLSLNIRFIEHINYVLVSRHFCKMRE